MHSSQTGATILLTWLPTTFGRQSTFINLCIRFPTYVHSLYARSLLLSVELITLDRDRTFQRGDDGDDERKLRPFQSPSSNDRNHTPSGCALDLDTGRRGKIKVLDKTDERRVEFENAIKRKEENKGCRVGEPMERTLSVRLFRACANHQLHNRWCH